MKQSGAALSYILGSAQVLMTPAVAREQKIALQVFSEAEALTLEALANAIVPGAQKAGISHYLDHHLTQTAENCLLMIKYLGIQHHAFTDFYQSGINNAHKVSQARYGRNWAALDAEQTAILLEDMTADNIPDWQGAPASFFFFVLRSDAADLVYGTAEGFAGIDFPSMAHISPPANW